MAPIYKGDKEVMPGELKLGNKDVKEVYLGTQKIWPPQPKSIVIYEHNVSPVPVPDPATRTFDFGNGYKLYWTCNWTHDSSVTDPVYAIKNTSNAFDSNDRMAVVQVISSGGSMPDVYNMSIVTPLVYVDDPNLPAGHKELFESNAVKGFKITVHRWNDMTRNPGQEIYDTRTNWTGDINQQYNGSTQSGGRADGVVQTPVGEMNIGNENQYPIPGDYLTDWDRSPFKATYNPRVPNVNRPYGYDGEGWFWAIKKVELVL